MVGSRQLPDARPPESVSAPSTEEMLRARLAEAEARLGVEAEARARAEEALRQAEERQRQLGVTDSLTGLYNSHHFHATLEQEVERARRFGDSLGLLLMDIDYFKAFNERYGHAEGDLALARLGRVMRESLRKIDSAFRYGGEEFTVILPRCNAAALRKLAERVRAAFQAEVFELDGEAARLTLSVGGTIYPRGAPIDAFIRAADRALCEAKAAGRNRVELATTR